MAASLESMVQGALTRSRPKRKPKAEPKRDALISAFADYANAEGREVAASLAGSLARGLYAPANDRAEKFARADRALKIKTGGAE